jgi:hypothetical protein
MIKLINIIFIFYRNFLHFSFSVHFCTSINSVAQKSKIKIMATIPIYNPQSPFLGEIPGGLRVGNTIKIRATIQGFHNR